MTTNAQSIMSGIEPEDGTITVIAKFNGQLFGSTYKLSEGVLAGSSFTDKSLLKAFQQAAYKVFDTVVDCGYRPKD